MSRMGLEISRLRKEIGMTQKQLAKAVGVSEGFIVEVEAGRRIINSDLISKISKALRLEAGKLDLYETEEGRNKPEPDRNVAKVIEKPIQKIWDDALAGVLATVPVYTYKMDNAAGTKKLPVIDNKVEGYPKDKVFYLIIEDDDMASSKVFKGDQALACGTNEIEKDGIFLIEYDEKRTVRQIKVIDGTKLLLVSSKGSLVTKTVLKKDVKVIARLVRMEIVL